MENKLTKIEIVNQIKELAESADLEWTEALCLYELIDEDSYYNDYYDCTEIYGKTFKGWMNTLYELQNIL